MYRLFKELVASNNRYRKEGTAMTDRKEQIIGEFQKNGKRITGQRKILLDVILEGKWSSCKEIYYMAAKRDPSIGLATVYRMVAALEELGFLSRGYHYSGLSEGNKQNF